jgi:hypothetical protein
MTTLALTSPVRPPRPIPLGRLVLVELRKSLDTRAARAVLLVFLGLGMALLAFTLAMESRPDFVLALMPAELLGPAFSVIGILAMTTEWSQKTASTTFRLVPRRERVLAAKVVGALALTLVTLAAVVAACLAVTAAILLADHIPLSGQGFGVEVRLMVAGALTSALFGLAWGALVTSTPIALVICFGVSFVLETLLAVALPDASAWLSQATVSDWLGAGGGFSGAVVTSFLLWYAAPLVLGCVLQSRRDPH